MLLEPEPCASHNEHRQKRCLNYGSGRIEISPRRLDDIYVLTRHNFGDLVRLWRSDTGNPGLEEWFVFQELGLCPNPFFSEFAIEAWNLYSALDGTERVATPAQYAALPALYVSVCKILKREVDRTMKIKQKMEEAKRKG